MPMSADGDKDWGPDLKAIEDRLSTSESTATIARDARDLLDAIPEDSPNRPRALRLLGKAIEARLSTSESPTTIARDARDLLDKTPEDSPHRPCALRLLGSAFNRCGEPDKALALLHQARQKAIGQ